MRLNSMHELYGAAIRYGNGLGLVCIHFTKTITETDRIRCPPLLSLLSMLLFIPSALGGDASESISEYLSRILIAWLVLPDSRCACSC